MYANTDVADRLTELTLRWRIDEAVNITFNVITAWFATITADAVI